MQQLQRTAKTEPDFLLSSEQMTERADSANREQTAPQMFGSSLHSDDPNTLGSNTWKAEPTSSRCWDLAVFLLFFLWVFLTRNRGELVSVCPGSFKQIQDDLASPLTPLTALTAQKLHSACMMFYAMIFMPSYSCHVDRSILLQEIHWTLLTSLNFVRGGGLETS